MPSFWQTDAVYWFLAKNLAFYDPPSLKFHNRTDINLHIIIYKYLYVLILDIHNINAIFEEEFSYLPGSQVEDTTRGWKRWSGRISRGASSLASEVSKSRHAFQCLKFRPINQKENQCKTKRTMYLHELRIIKEKMLWIFKFQIKYVLWGNQNSSTTYTW